MGVWATGLYSGDFALDLRSTVSALLRLPFPPDRIVDILCESETTAANNAADSDHTTFWLVVADQFAKRGVQCQRARDKALAVIDAGQDLAALEGLGMQASDLRKRRKMLEELRGRILSPPPIKTRKTLSHPQPFLVSLGDLLAYPTSGGKHINPYFPSKEMDKIYTKEGPKPWTQDGWGAMLVVDCGRAFDYLAWYRVLTLAEAMPQKPAAEQLLDGNILWRLSSPGTCSVRHYTRLELEKVGALPVNPTKVKNLFPGLRPGISAAVSDISISNSMSAAPKVSWAAIPEPGQHRRGLAQTLRGIEQILRPEPQVLSGP